MLPICGAIIASDLSCDWSECLVPPISTNSADNHQTTLNYAPVMIGSITLISLVGWFFPFGLGGRHWFKGPQKTIMDEDVLEVTVPDMG